eukprot:4274118-Amphidinium_carterae.1
MAQHVSRSPNVIDEEQWAKRTIVLSKLEHGSCNCSTIRTKDITGPPFQKPRAAPKLKDMFGQIGTLESALRTRMRTPSGDNGCL